MYLASNIRLLRKRTRKSQELVASAIGISRSAIASYESTGIEPDISTLMKFSDYFKVTLDKLIKTDLSLLSERVLSEIEKGHDIDLTGSRLRVLATTLDSNNDENIELVPEKARAGYTAGYSDPDYIKVLQTFSLPFLDRNRKYRAFPISGDSMPPVAQGSWVTGEYVQNWNHIRSGYPYIIVTKSEGIVFKMVYNNIEEKKSLRLVSTNTFYAPYDVDIAEVLEVWKFVNYIANEMPADDRPSHNMIAQAVSNIEKEVKTIRNTLRE